MLDPVRAVHGQYGRVRNTSGRPARSAAPPDIPEPDVPEPDVAVMSNLRCSDGQFQTRRTTVRITAAWGMTGSVTGLRVLSRGANLPGNRVIVLG